MALCVLTGCLDNPGLDPAAGQINFPTGLALSLPVSGESASLFVANSNFDLHYNSGSVQSLDLACLGSAVDACNGSDPCVITNESAGCTLVASEVRIGSHAVQLALNTQGDRLYVPVRSDNDITTIEVASNGTLACGDGNSSRHACSEDSRHGDLSFAKTRNVDLPIDPVAIQIGKLSDLGSSEPSDFLLVAHRNGEASFFVEQANAQPQLVDALSGLPGELTGIVRNPSDGLAWLTSGTESRLGRVGIALDTAGGSSQTTFLYNAGDLAVRNVGDEGASFINARATQFDPRAGMTLAYVLARSPEAVLVVDRSDTSSSVVPAVDAIDVGAGPSRMQLAELNGTLFAFVSCFDNRDLEILDLDQRRMVGITKGLSGPFELVVDVPRQQVYVADFRASVIRVISLAPMLACLDGTATVGDECVPKVVATIGEARAVGGL